MWFKEYPGHFTNQIKTRLQSGDVAFLACNLFGTKNGTFDQNSS